MTELNFKRDSRNYINDTTLLRKVLKINQYGHFCHKRIGVYSKHIVNDEKNLVNDDYELSS